MKFTKCLLLIAALFACIGGENAYAEDKTMCGYYAHDEEGFEGPERTTLDVQGRGLVKLEFAGMTPFYADGDYLCCFGDYSRSQNVLRVLTGCDSN